ncbi:sodium:calcium antiporter [Marinoscillum furvescens]|nr:sodium:calcium antiporter [Marinoscillum furvescens]
MDFFNDLSLTEATVIFGCCALLIAIGGGQLSKEGDRLADLTGMGEALFGALFLGAITSLSGLVTSVTAAHESHPQLAISNAIGGIAAQTVFLAIADITYRKTNLEHAAASLANIIQAVLLILLLGLLMTVSILPEIHFFSIHPASFILVGVYILAQKKLVSKSKNMPMWQAVKTDETRPDIPDEKNITQLSLPKTALKFTALGLVITICGYFLAQSAIVISNQTTISEGVMGAMFTSVASSLPELIVSIAAVRQGALTLAVSNIIGGNTFDILFVAVADAAYSDGSIYHTFESSQLFVIALTILLTAILTLGLLDREKRGFAHIGWESLLIILLFLGGYAVLFFL